MRPTTGHPARRATGSVSVPRALSTFALALAASFGFSRPSAAAEIDISGTGTFKPPSAEQVASLPPDMAFSPSDLASGTWSFLARYEDRTADADPDPYVGRYSGAIRVFRLTIGSTTMDLPVGRAELVISDGGLSFPHRESIRLEASTPTPYGVMRVAWIQLNQPPNRNDLRGTPGLLSSDALPEPSTIANLVTSRPFDRFLLVRLDGKGGESKPLLYISSSSVSVLASPAALK